MKQTPSFRRIALALLAATLCASAVPAFARTISATAGSAIITNRNGKSATVRSLSISHQPAHPAVTASSAPATSTAPPSMPRA